MTQEKLIKVSNGFFMLFMLVAFIASAIFLAAVLASAGVFGYKYYLTDLISQIKHTVLMVFTIIFRLIC